MKQKTTKKSNIKRFFSLIKLRRKKLFSDPIRKCLSTYAYFSLGLSLGCDDKLLQTNNYCVKKNPFSQKKTHIGNFCPTLLPSFSLEME